MFCAKCGQQIAEGVVYCTSCGGTQPPAKDAGAERVAQCPQCNRVNWREARQCYSCGAPLGSAHVASQPASAPTTPSTGATNTLALPDISASLPQEARQRLLTGEPAYAYVNNRGGCGQKPSQLLVTDSRVIVQGLDPS